MSSREQILDRIRRSGAANGFVAERVIDEQAPALDPVELFAEYAVDYKADVIRCCLADLGRVVVDVLAGRESKRVVVPRDLFFELPLEVVQDRGLSDEELDSMDAVVTGCAVAVAETGTVVLDAGSGQGRRALTLVPDHHVCVVLESQMAATVPQAVARVASSVREGRPLTWISGPSATSDIELKRVEGVHGPRKLDIVLVAD